MAVTILGGPASAAGPLSFEVASVKPAGPGEPNAGDIPRNMDASPGHLVMRNVPLRHALQWAWDLHDYEVSGPDWIKAENKYDIVANAAGPASENEMRMMLRSLLSERFQMKVHRESKSVDVYALLPGKGAPKVKEALATEETALGGAPSGIVFTKQPISRLTFMLSRRMDRPVLDMSGLKGLYDFTLDVSGLGFNGNPATDPNAPSIFTTIQEGLGLRLQPQKSPIEILVIDQVEKTPTAN